MRQPSTARPDRRRGLPKGPRRWVLLPLAAVLLSRTVMGEDLIGEGTIDGGWTGPVAKTEEEAARIAREILKHVGRPSKVSPCARVYWALPLLPMLDSENAAIRRIASEAFIELVAEGSEILLDECIPYLGPGRPIQERVPLLALCALQISGYGESASSDGMGEKVKSSLRQLAAECRVTPPPPLRNPRARPGTTAPDRLGKGIAVEGPT